MDTKTIIKEATDRMERTVDAVSDLADTLEEVELKYV